MKHNTYSVDRIHSGSTFKLRFLRVYNMNLVRVNEPYSPFLFIPNENSYDIASLAKRGDNCVEDCVLVALF